MQNKKIKTLDDVTAYWLDELSKNMKPSDVFSLVKKLPEQFYDCDPVKVIEYVDKLNIDKNKNPIFTFTINEAEAEDIIKPFFVENGITLGKYVLINAYKKGLIDRELIAALFISNNRVDLSFIEQKKFTYAYKDSITKASFAETLEKTMPAPRENIIRNKKSDGNSNSRLSFIIKQTIYDSIVKNLEAKEYNSFAHFFKQSLLDNKVYPSFLQDRIKVQSAKRKLKEKAVSKVSKAKIFQLTKLEIEFQKNMVEFFQKYNAKLNFATIVKMELIASGRMPETVFNSYHKLKNDFEKAKAEYCAYEYYDKDTLHDVYVWNRKMKEYGSDLKTISISLSDEAFNIFSQMQQTFTISKIIREYILWPIGFYPDAASFSAIESSLRGRGERK